MTNGLLRIGHFTDAACPFAFSAEPALLALRWLYGEQIEWHTRLVVLSERAGENEAKGLTVELIAGNDAQLAEQHGMPINSAVRPHLLVALPGDLAIKAVQLHRPELAEGFLRAMRVAWMTDHRPVDQRESIFAVAAESGVDVDELAVWVDDPATEAALREDMRAARSPLPAALGPLDHKLADSPIGRRYTCPSLEISLAGDPDTRFAAPGFENLMAYEVLLANIAPQLERRPRAGDPIEVLEWAAWPLATAEVAEVMGVSRAHAESALEESSARRDERGYWSVSSGNENQLAAGAASADRLVCGASLG
ncbi:MAG: DsbA family protein [Solirubrobacterales bacterium]